MDENRLKARWQREDDGKIDGAISACHEHENTRRLLWWLLEVGRVGVQPYTGNALATAFACGELNVGQRILDRITSVSPDGYVNMMKEMADARRERDNALDA